MHQTTFFKELQCRVLDFLWPGNVHDTCWCVGAVHNILWWANNTRSFSIFSEISFSCSTCHICHSIGQKTQIAKRSNCGARQSLLEAQAFHKIKHIHNHCCIYEKVRHVHMNIYVAYIIISAIIIISSLTTGGAMVSIEQWSSWEQVLGHASIK